MINHSAKLLLIGFATSVILRNIFAQRVIRADDVLGAVCGYLLAAGAFAGLYLVPLEALFGQFYIAIVVAQLVGARLSQRPL